MASKSNSAKKTRAEAERVLMAAAKRIECNNKELLSHPDDLEALHQYRISIRVARSLLLFVKPYCKKDYNRKLSRKLKTLQAPTSRLRELDMLVNVLHRGTREMYICEEARNLERESFIENLRSKKTQKMIKSVVAALEDVSWRSKVQRQGLPARNLAERVKEMSRVCAVELGVVMYEDHISVHDVRKRVKALRYITREFAACLPANAGDVSKQAKDVQDKLGELCDCRNNARLVMELCGPQSCGTILNFDKRANEIVDELNAQR